jgi:hypothetical protein
MQLQPSKKPVAFNSKAVIPERLLCHTWVDNLWINIAAFFLRREPTICVMLEVRALVNPPKVELIEITACDGDIEISAHKLPTEIQTALKEAAIRAYYEI